MNGIAKNFVRYPQYVALGFRPLVCSFISLLGGFVKHATTNISKASIGFILSENSANGVNTSSSYVNTSTNYCVGASEVAP